MVVGDQLQQLATRGVVVQQELYHILLTLHDGVVEAAPVASRPFRKEEHIVSTEDIGLCDYLRTRPKSVIMKHSQDNTPTIIHVKCKMAFLPKFGIENIVSQYDICVTVTISRFTMVTFQT